MKTFKILAGVLLVVVVVGGGWMAGRLHPDIDVDAAAPDVTFTTLEGSDLPVSDLRGKLVLLDFWSSN